VKKQRAKADFSRRLLNLISEPEFIQYEHILNEPNFFTIVGRTHYERWHSSFFGWLLDAGGSHLLSEYVLRRFLLLLTDESCLKPKTRRDHDFLLRDLPLVEFSDIQVSPNENAPSETSVVGIGRFDIFVSARCTGIDGRTVRINIIFELKIDSKPNFLIYISPRLLHDPFSTVGDHRWYCLDYQLLNDKLLLPLLDHPNLNDKVKPFLVQYVKNLKTRYRGIKMAITGEEKRLALALYEKYSDVFDSIYDALVSVEAIDYSTADIGTSKGRASGKMAIRINTRVFSSETVRILFEEVLRYLVDAELITKTPLPWGTSRSRYIATNEASPTHPNGRPFFYPVTYKGYTVESHYARDRAMKVLSDLCEKLEVDFEVIGT
jgi:hypothetical protein